jgi:hypothetical protein
MSFDKNKVLDWVKKNTKVGSTAQGSLRSSLYKLPQSASGDEVFVLVERKMKDTGQHPDKRKVVEAWEKDRIVW